MRTLFIKKNAYINEERADDIEYLSLKSGDNHKREMPMTKGRFFSMVAIILLITVSLFSRAFYLEIVKGQEYNNSYDSAHRKTEWILAPRGLITDREGAVLAYNMPSENPNEFKRFYPDGPLFSSIIGYIGKIDPQEINQSESPHFPFDLIGKSGIESAYDKFLAGTHGSIKKPVTAQGESKQEPLITDPKPGNTVVLTIDARIQKMLMSVLQEKMQEIHSPGAAAVMINPKTGEILSLVSLPSFDNNAITPELLEDPSHPLFNRAIAGEYPPGSAIKPFMASAALKEHIIDPARIIRDEGKIFVQSAFDPSVKWTFKSWKALGLVDMRRALALSSNIYFYTVGGGYKDIKGLGVARIKQYLELFGFGNKTGIDIPGEQGGFIPTPQWKKDQGNGDWYIGDTYNTAIGQGFDRVTPLQLALATTVVANRGTLYTPYVFKEAKNEEGKELFSSQPKIIREGFINPEYLDIVREGMKLAVKEGTVIRLSKLGIDIGAKTGTAQAGIGLQPHAWVTLFAPYDDPQIVLTIFLEHGIGGEQSAVPVAKTFLEWWLKNKN